MTDTPDDQLGARPSRPQSRDDLAAWSSRTFRSETPLVERPPGDISLDDELPYDLTADIEQSRAHIAALRADGLL